MTEDLARAVTDAAACAIAAEHGQDFVCSSEEYEARTAVAAALRTLHEHGIVFIAKGHLGPTMTPQPAALAARVEGLDGTGP